MLRHPAMVTGARSLAYGLRSGFVVLALLLLLGACSSSSNAPPPAAASTAAVADSAVPVEDRYLLGPGDKLRVTIFGHEDLSGEFEVDGLGNITLPLVGEVPAKGRSETVIEKDIIAKLSPQYLKDPNVSVDVLNYRPFYIFGEVNAPGSYPYVNGMTVINAVALAGGFTYRARTGTVNVTRSGDTSGEPQEAAINAQVFPGDVIEVRERYF